MKKWIVFLIAFALCVPAIAVVTEPSTGVVRIVIQGPAKYATGACKLIVGDQTCSGSVQNKTFVQIGVCTQQEADDSDPVATQACNAAQVAAGRCPAEWQDQTTMISPGACAKILDAWTKGVIAAVGRNGMKIVEAERAPTPGDDTGEFGDP